MACLPYDMLNIFDMTSDKPAPAIQLTGLGSTAENVSEIFSNQPAASGTSYGNIFSILKVRFIYNKHYIQCPHHQNCPRL